MSQANPIIQIENVHKRFGKVHALRGISTTVGRGEVLVLIGPSGSGKSTLLRCINGLERPESGRVIVDGIPLDNSSDHINAVRAEVGIVFQQFNLFPHLSVLQNIALAQQIIRKRSPGESKKSRVNNLPRSAFSRRRTRTRRNFPAVNNNASQSRARSQ